MSATYGLKCDWSPAGYKWRIFRTTMQIKQILLILLATCCMHNVLCHDHDFDSNNRFAVDVKSFFHLLPKKCFDIRDKYTEYLSSRGLVLYCIYDIVH